MLPGISLQHSHSQAGQTHSQCCFALQQPWSHRSPCRQSRVGLNILGHSPYSVAGARAGSGEGPRPPSRSEAGWGPRPNSRSGGGSRLATPAGRPLSRPGSHAGPGAQVRLHAT